MRILAMGQVMAGSPVAVAQWEQAARDRGPADTLASA